MGDKCEYLYIGGMRVPMENVLITYVPWEQHSAITQSFRVVGASPGRDRGEPPYIQTIKELKKLLKHNENSKMSVNIYDPKTKSPVGEPFEFDPSKALGRAGRKLAAKGRSIEAWEQFADNEFVAEILAKGVSYGVSEELTEINIAQLDWLARTPAGIKVIENVLDSADSYLMDVKLTLAAIAAADTATIVPLSSKVREAFSNLAPLAVALGFAKAASTTDSEQGNEDDNFGVRQLLDEIAKDNEEYFNSQTSSDDEDYEDDEDDEDRLREIAQDRADRKLWASTPEVLCGLHEFVFRSGRTGGTGIYWSDEAYDVQEARHGRAVQGEEYEANRLIDGNIRPWLEANPDPEVQIAAIKRAADQFGSDAYDLIDVISVHASSDLVREAAAKISKGLELGDQNWLADQHAKERASRHYEEWTDPDDDDYDENLDRVERAERELTAELKDQGWDRAPTVDEVVERCTLTSKFAVAPAEAAKTYKIGDAGPAGGIIFAVESGMYLEAAPEDIGEFKWDKARAEATRYTTTRNGVTYNDWHLPSKDELSAMYDNRDRIGGFSAATYWSSSENDDNYAWNQYFTNGSQTNLNKNFTYSVRPVRAFSI